MSGTEWHSLELKLWLFLLASGAVVYPFTISPKAAVIAMAGSSALVAINARMLKRTRLAGIRRVRAGAVVPVTAAAA